MGMTSSAQRRQGRGRRRGSYGAISEINVTPFVDVMLVLLIVFMVAAPMLTAGVPVDLPKSQARPITENDDRPVEITVTKDGKIFIGETEVERERFIALLSNIIQNDTEKRIFVRGDQTIAYGQVMDIIGQINKAGFRKVALITNPSAN